MVVNISQGQGYGDSQGLFCARKAIMQHYQSLGVPRVQIEDIYLGNGVSEADHHCPCRGCSTTATRC